MYEGKLTVELDKGRAIKTTDLENDEAIGLENLVTRRGSAMQINKF
jgi:hypothetical protein